MSASSNLRGELQFNRNLCPAGLTFNPALLNSALEKSTDPSTSWGFQLCNSSGREIRLDHTLSSAIAKTLFAPATHCGRLAEGTLMPRRMRLTLGCPEGHGSAWANGISDSRRLLLRCDHPIFSEWRPLVQCVGWSDGREQCCLGGQCVLPATCMRLGCHMAQAASWSQATGTTCQSAFSAPVFVDVQRFATRGLEYFWKAQGASNAITSSRCRIPR